MTATKAAQNAAKNLATPDDGVLVEGHNVWVHNVPAYLLSIGASLDEYKAANPAAPLYSQKMLEAKRRKEAEVTASMATAASKVAVMAGSKAKESFAKIFDLGDAPAAKNARGEDIKCIVLGPNKEYGDFVPPLDEDYIFPIDQLKCVMVAAELNKPMLVWGMHGTGKTTLVEQYCARTNRAAIRVQHTVGTEKSDLVGHYVVKAKEVKQPDGTIQMVSTTIFEPGPLMLAMRHGLVYIADEYDYALPSVTSVYQAVLEGKPLVTPEAPPEWRVVKPHEDFRIYATGNTNGSGDETGLYNGTQVMNAANYSRFAITIQLDYMPAAQEIAVIVAKTKMHKDDATVLVKCAEDIRKAHARNELSTTISPREIINAAGLARVFGAKPDLRKGMQLAFCNRLNSIDRKAVDDFCQRHFG